MTPEKIKIIRGCLVIKNMTDRPITLPQYNNFTFLPGQQIDLVSIYAPRSMQHADYFAACRRVCEAPLKDYIDDGKFEIIEQASPNPSGAWS